MKTRIRKRHRKPAAAPVLPPRIVVEVATPEVVKQLQEENRQLRDQMKLMQGRHDKLHETLYKHMSNFIEFKRSLKD